MCNGKGQSKNESQKKKRPAKKIVTNKENWTEDILAKAFCSKQHCKRNRYVATRFIPRRGLWNLRKKKTHLMDYLILHFGFHPINTSACIAEAPSCEAGCPHREMMRKRLRCLNYRSKLSSGRPFPHKIIENKTVRQNIFPLTTLIGYHKIGIHQAAKR